MAMIRGTVVSKMVGLDGGGGDVWYGLLGYTSGMVSFIISAILFLFL